MIEEAPPTPALAPGPSMESDMAKKKKKMSALQAAKTIIDEHIKIYKLKAKIGERKRTNAVLKRMRSGQTIPLKDSARAAQAVEKKLRRKK